MLTFNQRSGGFILSGLWVFVHIFKAVYPALLRFFSLDQSGGLADRPTFLASEPHVASAAKKTVCEHFAAVYIQYRLNVRNWKFSLSPPFSALSVSVNQTCSEVRLHFTPKKTHFVDKNSLVWMCNSVSVNSLISFCVMYKTWRDRYRTN